MDDLMKNLPNSYRAGPDEQGHFGIFGGRFVAETLMPLILDLEKAYAEAKADPSFKAEMNGYLKDDVLDERQVLLDEPRQLLIVALSACHVRPPL